MCLTLQSCLLLTRQRSFLGLDTPIADQLYYIMCSSNMQLSRGGVNRKKFHRCCLKGCVEVPRWLQGRVVGSKLVSLRNRPEPYII